MGRPKGSALEVTADNDMRLNPSGKQCAPAGRPHLPGGMQRTHSEPNGVLTAPGRWLHDHQSQQATMHREHQDRQRASSLLSASMTGGLWADNNSRPSTCPEGLPAGGHTQGARHLRPSSSASSIGYDNTKHHWYHPKGMAESARLVEPGDSASWAWTMRKARDHVGYGDDGVVNWGDVQCTAISADTPDWLVGPRTLPGPRGTRKCPVRRCPVVQIDGKTMRTRAKTFKQGHHLDTIETLHETQRPASSARHVPKKNPLAYENRCKINHLDHGGCQTKKEILPPSTFVTYDNFDPHGERS